MARSHLYRTVQSLTGDLISGASVSVCQPGTTTPITAPLFAAFTGAVTLNNPFQALNGVVDFYLDNPQDVDLIVSYGSSSVTAERVSVAPPADTLFSTAAPLTITNNPSPLYLLAGIDSAHASWVDPATVDTGVLNVDMPVPSDPQIQLINGMTFVMWDGLDATHNPMPQGFDRVLVQMVSDTTDTIGALLGPGGVQVPINAPASLQLVAQNRAGGQGLPSALVSFLDPTVLYPTAALQSTVGAATGAGVPLPAHPVQYLPIAVGGVSYVLPLYPMS